MNLYGTTAGGGVNNYGTAFQISLSGVLTTLYSFCAQQTHKMCPYGRTPAGGLVQGTDGNLYGTAYAGGTGSVDGYGTIYKLTTQGRITVEHSFDSTDGAYPANADLVQGTDGSFYGVTQNGGAFGVGTLFNLGVGLTPFVRTQTSFGKVGTQVVILGTNLTGATDVTFNGTTAIFIVVSSSEIEATVPTGATTGPVGVMTPIGTLKSSKIFTVLK